MNRSCNFDVLLDSESSELYLPTLFYDKRRQTWNFGRYWQLHTQRQTEMATQWRTWPGGPSQWKKEKIAQLLKLITKSHQYVRMYDTMNYRKTKKAQIKNTRLDIIWKNTRKRKSLIENRSTWQFENVICQTIWQAR